MTAVRRRVVAPLTRILATAVVMVVAALGAAGCGSDEPGPAAASIAPGVTAGTGALLSVAEFAAALERSGTTLVDVRSPEEFAAGHLEGAVNMNVEDPGFADAVAGLDPNGRYAVYCRSGNRSAVAVTYLADHGFDSVVHLDGGIVAWADAGRPVTTS